MIKAPVAVDNTAGGTVLITASDVFKCKAVILQNPASGNAVALAFDGSADAVTFANGLLLAAGTERVIECDNNTSATRFANGIKAIADVGLPSTIRIHGIE